MQISNITTYSKTALLSNEDKPVETSHGQAVRTLRHRSAEVLDQETEATLHAVDMHKGNFIDIYV